MKYKKFELKLKDGFKVAEKSIYELNKIIDISSKILPRKADRLALFKRQIKEKLVNDKNKGSSQQLISVAARILGLLFLLDADIFEEKVLLQEWFNRLIVDLLFEIKFNFYKIPTEFVEKLNQLKSSIELKYPKFYNSILNKFLTYEYDSMFFPYQTKVLTFNQYYEDLNFVPIKELKKVGDSRKVYIVITFFFSKDKKFLERKKYFIQNIERIFDQSYKNFEICITLNNANKELHFAETLKKKFNLNKIVVAYVNVGCAKSRNIWTREILKSSKENDFILYLDDDTYLNDKDVILKLVYAFDINCNLGCVAPQISYGGSTRSPILVRGYESPWEFTVFKAFGKLSKETMERRGIFQETFLAEASCLLISTKYLRQIQLFPEEYNYYHDETLLENRIRLKLNKYPAVVKNAYALHQRIGGGAVTEHTIYYYFRNFGYLLHDLGIAQVSIETYNLIMKQFYDYCLMIIKEKENKDNLLKRLNKGRDDLEKYEKGQKRKRSNQEFDADGYYKFV